MLLKQFTYILLGTLLFSCVEKTEENSKYKEYISTIKTSMNGVDSAYSVYEKIDHDSLLNIQASSKKKYKYAKKTIAVDTLDLFYENSMAVYKSILVKKLKDIDRKKTGLDKEYGYSKKQTKALIDNLIQETFTEDSAAIFFNSENEALFILRKEMEHYNSIAHKTFNIKDSLNHNLDSLIGLYVEPTN